MSVRTVFGSLKQHEKGRIQIIRDDPKNYAFSNVFDVASKVAPWDRVAVARNMEYVLEAVRAEGTVAWRRPRRTAWSTSCPRRLCASGC